MPASGVPSPIHMRVGRPGEARTGHCIDRNLGWLLRTMDGVKAENGFIDLKIGAYLAYNLWDLPLLALAGEVWIGHFFCAAIRISDAVRAPCGCSPRNYP